MFAHGASFKNVIFRGDATFFRSTHFQGGDHTWFDGSCFTSDVYFNDAQIGKIAWFDKVSFEGNAEFINTKFNSLARFIEAKFSGLAVFDTVSFAGQSRFDNASFKDDALFRDMTFVNYASYENATFLGVADFSATESGGNEENKFSRLNFRGVRFSKNARFTNRRFLDTTDFSATQFRGSAPEFHNCELHQDTRFSSATKFADTSPESASAYRTLKLAMEAMRARDDQARFFALEQRCRRADRATPLLVRVGSWLYDIMADYGQSVSRPLEWLFGVFGAFYLFNLAVSIGQTNSGTDLADVLRFTLEQVFRPFHVFATDETPLWLATIAAVHSLSNFAILTLFIIAMRRRFRMG